MDGSGRRWLTANARTLKLLAPTLVVAGVAGFVLPDHPALMSVAAPYNLFHLAAGILGLILQRAGRPGLTASFNLLFGLVDLWQVVAGLSGLFPAGLFGLRAADHAVHAFLGAALVVVGGGGVAALRRGARRAAPAAAAAAKAQAQA